MESHGAKKYARVGGLGREGGGGGLVLLSLIGFIECSGFFELNSSPVMS